MDEEVACWAAGPQTWAQTLSPPLHVLPALCLSFPVRNQGGVTPSSLGAVVRAAEPKPRDPGRPGADPGSWRALGTGLLRAVLKSGLKPDEAQTARGHLPGPSSPRPWEGVPVPRPRVPSLAHPFHTLCRARSRARPRGRTREASHLSRSNSRDGSCGRHYCRFSHFTNEDTEAWGAGSAPQVALAESGYEVFAFTDLRQSVGLVPT